MDNDIKTEKDQEQEPVPEPETAAAEEEQQAVNEEASSGEQNAAAESEGSTGEQTASQGAAENVAPAAEQPAQPKEPAQLCEATLKARVLLARDELAQYPVAHDLQDGAAALPEGLLVPDATEHEADVVCLKLKLALLGGLEVMQLLFAEVAGDYRRHLVAPKVVRDDVEEILVIDMLVVVLDDIPPELHSLTDARRPPDVLVSCHVNSMPVVVSKT